MLKVFHIDCHNDGINNGYSFISSLFISFFLNFIIHLQRTYLSSSITVFYYLFCGCVSFDSAAAGQRSLIDMLLRNWG